MLLYIVQLCRAELLSSELLVMNLSTSNIHEYLHRPSDGAKTQ